MNLRLIIARIGFVGGILLGITASASEAEGKVFSYLGLKGGYSHQAVGESTPINKGSGVGVPGGGDLTTLPGYTTPAVPIGAVLGMGYRFIHRFGIRLEAEYLYRMALSSAKPNIDQGAGAAPTFDNINILTNASSALVNIYVDYYILPRVNMYLGTGIGTSMLDTNLKFSTAQGEGKIQGDKVNFMWQFGGGVAMSITQHIKLDLGVRFVNFGKATISTYQFAQSSPMLPEGLLSFGITNIETLMGLSYHF